MRKPPSRASAKKNLVTAVVLWESGPVEGELEITNGKLAQARIAQGEGAVRKGHFAVAAKEPCALEVSVADARTGAGWNPTLITVREKTSPFTFFLRDVTTEHPVLIPAYGVAVVPAGDGRWFRDVARDVRRLARRTALQSIEQEPEESYENAAAHTRILHCPIWLGLSRDIRIFEFDTHSPYWWGAVKPRFHGSLVYLPEAKDEALSYAFMLGRGVGCEANLSRHIEDGTLPILHATSRDSDVIYNVTAFVTLERSPLTAKNLRGTHFMVADGHGAGHMFTPEQQKEYESLLPEEMSRDEETVFCLRAEAVNTASVPRYAWFRAPALTMRAVAGTFDGKSGFLRLSGDRVCCVCRLNGEPLPNDELAVLVQPGEAAVLEFYIPHRPIPEKRARALARLDFPARHAECRAFWQAKLAAAAQLSLPERRIEEMARAGLLHLDLVAYGLEPDGTLTACIGVYCPIGTESSPIIQFIDSMGWHQVAERAVNYFLDKQHDDGFIQNFGGYMVETGAALWTMGEHYRYTRDDKWVRKVAPKLIKACEFLIAWRRRNQKEELRGRGYGLIDGKVADPEDPVHYFMNNGYACVGMKRVAEMLRNVDPQRSKELAAEAEQFRQDIRAALAECMARSPVAPLGDGTWCPTAPPWAEYRGPTSLYADGGRCYSHGTFLCRDSMLGPQYLILHEVLEPHEPAAEFIMNVHADLFCQRNAAFSQPYYSRHDFAHVKRGEVKPFIKTYYNTFSALADRETHTFWEHFFHASPHKTHEEGWFLMQTRWMLYMEEGDTLRLLPAVPRAWLEAGKRIALRNVATYFGPVSLEVESDLEHGVIRASVECRSDRQPAQVELRLPHPEGRRARAASGGAYDAERELVCIAPFKDRASVVLTF